MENNSTGRIVIVVSFIMQNQEVSEELVRKKIRDPSDFEWLKQSRFHWREDRDTVITSICDVDFEYSFEYLGAPITLIYEDVR